MLKLALFLSMVGLIAGMQAETKLAPGEASLQSYLDGTISIGDLLTPQSRSLESPDSIVRQRTIATLLDWLVSVGECLESGEIQCTRGN